MDREAFNIFNKNKERSYRNAFQGSDGKAHEAAKAVLADLRYYCGATKSNFSHDALEMAKLEGRREVFNRIMTFLKVDYEEYHDLEQDFDV